MRTNLLKDNWCVSGDTLPGLKEALLDITLRTKVIRVMSNEMSLLLPAGEVDEEGRLPVMVCSASGSRKATVKKSNFLEYGLSEEEWEESLKRGFVARTVANKRNIYLMFDNIVPDIAQNYGLLGPALTEETGAQERNEYIMRLIEQAPKILSLVLRSGSGKMSKALTVRSKSYGYIPQTVIVDAINGIIDDLGDGEVQRWNVDHIRTNVDIEFPKMSEDINETYGLEGYKVIVRIIDSDAGEASFRVMGILSKNGHEIFSGGEVARKHSGEPNIADLVNSVHKTIFDKFTVLPGYLCSMSAMDIPAPATFIRELLESGSAQVGKRLAEKIANALIAELPEGEDLNALNIYEMLMGVPERVEAPESTKRSIRKWLSQLPAKICTEKEITISE